jgi:hypothetical protein
MNALDRLLEERVRETAKAWGLDLKKCNIDQYLAVVHAVLDANPLLKQYVAYGYKVTFSYDQHHQERPRRGPILKRYVVRTISEDECRAISDELDDGR